jgi:hypothetical protein
MLPIGRTPDVTITLHVIPQIRPTKIDGKNINSDGDWNLGKLISLANVRLENLKR